MRYLLLALLLTACSPTPEPELPTMHPTWDKDGDGMNDCEKDGTCDHTVDYTKPKPGTYDFDSWKGMIPDDCESFFDGCNNCRRQPGSDIAGCTRKYCFEYGEPRCLDEEEFNLSGRAKAIESPDDLKLIDESVPIYDDMRVFKKSFGDFITPASSPVQPERFSGYHAGTDFEVMPSEDPHEIEVTAICSGPIKIAQWIKGYGGVMIQSCEIGGEPVTVLYGHVRLKDAVPAGSFVEKGSPITVLGEGFSKETDGERAHLHLAIHKGSTIEYRGYVQSEAELSKWMDPADVL